MFKKKIANIKKINTKRIFVILCLLCFVGLFIFSFTKSFSDFAFISTSYADRDEEGYGGGFSFTKSFSDFAFISTSYADRDEEGYGGGESGSSSTGSFGDNKKKDFGIFQDIVDWILELLYSPARENLKECYSDEEMQTLTELLDLGKDEYYGSAWGVMNNAFNLIKPIGFALITTFFLIYLFDLASKDQMTFDMLVKLGVQLIIVVAIAAKLDLIVNELLEIGQGVFTKLSKGFSVSGFNDKEIDMIVDEWKTKYLNNAPDAVSPLGALIKTFLLRFCVLIGEIACAFAAISRMLDVGWRVVFSPIGIANSFEGGANSGGVRYLKGLFAAIIAGAVMWVIFQIGFNISAAFLKNSGGSFFNYFMSAGAIFATAGASFSASQKAKEIIT